MKSNLPLLAIGAGKEARVEPSAALTVDDLGDDLKAIILASMKHPASVCGMIQLWARVRKVKEGPTLWTMVYAMMGVPGIFFPEDTTDPPTKDDLEQLCKDIGAYTSLKEMMKKAVTFDNVEATEWLIQMGRFEYFLVAEMAAAEGSMQALDFLWQRREPVPQRTENKWQGTMIIKAAERGQVQSVQFIMDRVSPVPASHVHFVANHGFKSAARHNRMDVVRWFIDQGKFQLTWDDGFATVWSARNGNVELMQLCLQNGVTEWWRALEEAARFGKIHAMEFAYANGATEPAHLDDAFKAAALSGRVMALRWLAERAEANWGELLEEAEIFGETNTVAFLRSKLSESP